MGPNSCQNNVSSATETAEQVAEPLQPNVARWVGKEEGNMFVHDSIKFIAVMAFSCRVSQHNPLLFGVSRWRVAG